MVRVAVPIGVGLPNSAGVWFTGVIEADFCSRTCSSQLSPPSPRHLSALHAEETPRNKSASAVITFLVFTIWPHSRLDNFFI